MSSNAGAFIRWETQRRAAAGDHLDALELLGLIESQDAALAVLRGRILGQLGRFGAAEESFRGALASEPDNAEAKRGLELAERLAVSPLARLRLHARRWLAALATVGVLATGVASWTRGVSNTELARLLAALDRKMATSETGRQANNRELTERISRLGLALLGQAEASGRSSEQYRDQLHRLQEQLATLVTKKELKAARAEMTASLERLESAAGTPQKR